MADGDTDPMAGPAGDSVFKDVPVILYVSVGRAKLPVGELLAIERNAVIALDRNIEDPVSIHAGDRIVAYGELQELEDAEDGRLAVRITEIVDGEQAP
ncbi:MAG: FliM/FliN family flagellar motor switch protein [Pseudomonadota bacterium]